MATPNATLKTRLIEYLTSHPNRALKLRAIARAIELDEAEYPELREIARAAIEAGDLILGPGRTLRLPAPRSQEIEGQFRLHRRGFGFLEVPGREDVFVRRDDTGSALDGDTVRAEFIEGRRGRDELPRARILSVKNRSAYNWVGVIEQEGRHWFVQPTGRSHMPRIQIEDPSAKSARAGEMVVVEPLPPRRPDEPPTRGVIIERLGDASETQTALTAVIRRFELPEAFSAEVRSAARQAADHFDPDNIGDREDLRQLVTLTIDPLDARDFDDAISIEQLPHGQTRLGVHIADVATFVAAGSPLDLEAYQRGNSVYFPKRVVPMLPEILSNGVCSLQPQETRYTLSAFLTYDQSGKVVSERLARSAIRSARRFGYEEVSDYLKGAKLDAAEPVWWTLTAAERLAKRIERRRRAAGMITLSLPDVDIQFDAAEHVVGARPADDSYSHKIIEMFMVEANEAASRFLRRRGVDHLRRVHGTPRDKASGGLARLRAALGDFEIGPDLNPVEIQRIIEEVRGKPHESAIHYLLLRTMAQAHYSPALEGHFALASEDYCHFTSPIRRYPDLVIHRLLHLELADRRDAALRQTMSPPAPATLAEAGRHTSRTERTAQQAEREAKTILILDHLAKHLGLECDGVITGVEPFGLFVQIRPWLVDGIVPLELLRPERWQYDDDRERLVAARTRRFLAVGQTIRVTIESVDAQRLEMTLAPLKLERIGEPLPAETRQKRTKPGRSRTGKPGRGPRRRR